MDEGGRSRYACRRIPMPRVTPHSPTFEWPGEDNHRGVTRLFWGLALLAAAAGTWYLLADGVSVGVAFYYALAALLFRPAYALQAAFRTVRRLLRSYGDRVQAVGVGRREDDPLGLLLLRLRIVLATEKEVVIA